MTDEQFRERIEKNLARALQLLNQGKSAKARVCARMAAGEAVAWYVEKNHRSGWGHDLISLLVHLKTDSSFPSELREAANRLSSRITPEFTYPADNDPLRDAQTIVDYFQKLLEHGLSF